MASRVTTVATSLFRCLYFCIIVDDKILINIFLSFHQLKNLGYLCKGGNLTIPRSHQFVIPFIISHNVFSKIITITAKQTNAFWTKIFYFTFFEWIIYNNDSSAFFLKRRRRIVNFAHIFFSSTFESNPCLIFPRIF
jgi:hypothetical protein